MRKKKILLRLLAFLVVAAVGAALVNPYFRQRLFGPTYQGAPLCVWQESLRKQTLGENSKDFLAKTIQWFQPKLDALPFDKLTRDENIAIWTSLLHDPAPAMRARVIQALWGGQGWAGARLWDFDGTASTIFLNGSTVWTSGGKYTTVNFIPSGKLRYNLASLVANGYPYALAGLRPALDVTPELIAMLDDDAEEVRAAVFNALQAHGRDAAPAFPRLHELLGHADSKRRVQAAETLNGTHPKTRAWLDRLLAMLDDGDADVRLAAINCVSSWHDRRQAVAAGPPLAKALQDADARVRLSAATTLGALRVQRAPATAALGAAMRHPDAAVRRQAVQSLFDSAGKQLYEELVRLARADPDENVQTAAVYALWHGGARAVPLLITLLRHPKAPVRQSAIGALQAIGPPARVATPYLLALLEEHGAQAIQALAAIGDTDALPKLIDLLEHPNRDLRSQALSALPGFGAAAKPAVPKLLALVRDQEKDLWPQALNALIQIDPDHEGMLTLVDQFARSESAEQRRQVSRAVEQLGSRMRRLVPELVRRLREPIDVVRCEAALLLGALGPDAQAAVPALLRLAEDPKSENQPAYVTALGKIAADADQVVPLLHRLLREDKLTSHALSALAGFGHRAAAAVPEVHDLLKKSDHQLAAITTIAAIQPDVDALLTVLTPLLRDEDDASRHAVAGLLGDLGPAGRSAVPELSRLLDDDTQSLYEAALRALAKIEP